MGCLDENTVAELLEGRLSASARGAVELHLDGCAECRDLVGEVARGSDAGAAPGALAGEPLAPGLGFGRYVILGFVGGGAMGSVYAAYDPELDRRVALKLLKPPAPGDEPQRDQRARMQREARAMARLAHPHVVAVHDVGQDGEVAFVAMEFVDGGTLAQWLREAPRSWREIVELFVGAGRGLAAAHAAGLVHRDFKPANVLVGRDGRARVTDFGLAVAASAGAAASGRVAGTPAYMAPEQLAGAPHDVRSDLYSFCVSLHEALYGARPSREGKAEPPAGAAVPKRLQQILEKGLRARPEERYPSMDALLADLARDAAGARRRMLRAAALGAAVALAGLAGTLWWARHQVAVCDVAETERAGLWDEARARDVERAFTASGSPYGAEMFAGVDGALRRYSEAWLGARREACLATRVRGEQSAELMDRRMACLDARRGAARALIAVFSAADRDAVEHSAQAAASLPELARCADPQYLLAQVKPPERAVADEVARLRAARAQTMAGYLAGHYAAALGEAGALSAQAAAVRYPPVRAEIDYLLGLVQDFGGQPEAAAVSLARAYFAARVAGHDEIAALSATALVDVFGWELARDVEAGLWAEHARAEVDRSGKGTRVEADLETQLGLLEERRGHDGEAARHYRQALAVLRAIGEGEGVFAARLHTHLGAVSPSPAEAIAEYERSLAVRANVLPASHPDNVNTLFMLALAHADAGRPAAAAEHARRAIAVAEPSLGHLHPKTASAYSALGEALTLGGDYPGALRALATAGEILRATRPPDHPNVVSLEARLGAAYAGAGEIAPALEHARRAVEIATRTRGADHPQTAISLRSLGLALRAAGRREEAAAALARAEAIFDRSGGDAATLAALGGCLLDGGRPAEAVAPLERALALRTAQGADPRLVGEVQRKLEHARAAR